MIRIGIVGYGLRAWGLHKIMRETDPQFKLVGIVDPDEKTVREKLSEDDRDVRFYPDIDTLVREGKVDGLVIGTRCNLHTPLAIEAARYKIPVWLEKPVAISMEQARELEEQCDAERDRFLISFPLRATPIARRVSRMLDSGCVGDVVHFNAINYVSYGGVYFETAYRKYEVTQGLFLQKATHDFDYLSMMLHSRVKRVAARWSLGKVFGGDKPESLRCGDCPDTEKCMESPFNRVRNNTGGDLGSHLCPFSSRLGTPESGMNEDASSALIEFENGVHGVYSQVFFTRRTGMRGATFSGYKGTLSFDWPNKKIDFTEHFAPFTTHMEVPGNLSHGGGDHELAWSFRNMILSGATPAANLEDGLNSIYACLAAKESAQTAQFVEVRHFGDR